MNILAIETATDACSCALEYSGAIATRHTVEPRRHTELLLPMIDSVLGEAGAELGSLDAIAFGRGPGSFTGLRIACAVAQGLGFGADRPLIAVSTLQVVAVGMHRSHGVRRVLVALDARMGEVYWGGFAWDGVTMAPVFDESVVPPHAVHVPAGGAWAGAGSGWSAYRAALDECLAGHLAVRNWWTRHGCRRRSTCSHPRRRRSRPALSSRPRTRRPCTCAAKWHEPRPSASFEGGEYLERSHPRQVGNERSVLRHRAAVRRCLRLTRSAGRKQD